MLLSMTGFGQARTEAEGLLVSIEIRTVNNRYLKLSTRLTDGYNAIEQPIESTIRKSIRRGTVQANIRISRVRQAGDWRLNEDVLEAYRLQIDALGDKWNLAPTSDLTSLLGLPGVVEDVNAASQGDAAEAVWPLVEKALVEALQGLQEMRAEEGRAMEADLRVNLRAIGEALEKIQTRAPAVVENYRERMTERLERVLRDHDVTLEPSDIIREVAIFADRCDISEEIVRLQSHIEQFDAIISKEEGAGRKLDFLTQEMVRESNTIGSKANDFEIAQNVVEIKSAIERIREMIQNVE